MIRFRCSRCGKKLKADLTIIGRKVKCSRCDLVVTVPESDDLTRPVVSEEDAKLAGRENVAKSKKISAESSSFNEASDSSTDFSELFSDSELDSKRESDPSVVNNEEPIPELFGHSAAKSSAAPTDGPQFKPQPKKFRRKVKLNRWVIPGILALCGIVVVGLVASHFIRQAYSEPKFRAEFEKMEEVQYYRRALVNMEKSQRRMFVISESIFLQGLGDDEMKQNVDSLTASAKGYTSNTRNLLTDAAKMMLSGEEVKAKGLLVNTGREMKSLTTSIEEALGEFQKKMN